jgi:hypothetical protein
MLSTQKAAKGFRLPKRTARLVFEGNFEGAEVVVRLDVKIGDYIKIQDLLSEERYLEVFEVFADAALDEWNLERDDGTPIPATGTGMKEIDITMATRILTEWTEVATQPPAPLEEA